MLLHVWLWLLHSENFAIKGDGFPITDAIAKYEGNMSVEGTIEKLARAKFTSTSLWGYLVLLGSIFSCHKLLDLVD